MGRNVHIAVYYTQIVTAEQYEALVAYARICGHDFDKASERNIVKRLLEESGTSVVRLAMDYHEQEKVDAAAYEQHQADEGPYGRNT